jgi:site-specific recombinase XerD
MEGALQRKVQNAVRERNWQWVFPRISAGGTRKPVSRGGSRAVISAEINKSAMSHLRHSFATHLIERGHAIRTSMIYTQVLNRGPCGISSQAVTL